MVIGCVVWQTGAQILHLEEAAETAPAHNDQAGIGPRDTRKFNLKRTIGTLDFDR